MAYSAEIIDAITRSAEQNAELPHSGKSVNFACGCVITISMDVSQDGTIRDVACRSNGCGHIFAAADRLRNAVIDTNTTEVAARLALIGNGDRPDCTAIVREAFDACLDAVRRSRIDSFDGDSPLVCSCFGVAESDLIEAMRSDAIKTVDELSAATRAGRGCGACRMVLAELIDVNN